MKEAINAIAKDHYSFKILNNEKVKIQPHSAENYTSILEELKKRNILCYTYQIKQKRNFKVVLRGLHHTANREAVIKEIEKQQHKVEQMTNIINNKTETPTALFFIEIKQRDNNKDIYKILAKYHG